MAKGFNQAFQFRPVPKIAGVEHDSTRRVLAESKPSYSAEAASVVLGAELVGLRKMRRDGLIRSEVPDEFSEEELRALYEEVRDLREEGVIE
jgi:hypothetical protein